MLDPKQIVKQGYDTLADAYRTFYSSSHQKIYPVLLQLFTEKIPKGGKVLELGCGDGIPVAQLLSKEYDYLGIDMSPVQVALAQQHVSAAKFMEADMTQLSFPHESIEGIIALYSIIHVSVEEQYALFSAVYDWLKPRGTLMCIVGHQAWVGTDPHWILPNNEMYWSHTDEQTYLDWFSEIGLEILQKRFLLEGNGGHTLISNQIKIVCNSTPLSIVG